MKHRFKSKSSKRLLPLAFVLGGSCIWGNSIAMETHSLRMEKNVTEQSQRSVVGKVVDETGESLPGVTVLVEGSSRGVITDVDGTFTINVSDADKLVISYIGMQTEVIPIEKKKKFCYAKGKG